MATQEGVTRISAQQQKQAGFSDPREFSEALTQMENQGRSLARQGRSILRREGTAPTFDVAELETPSTEMVTPEPSTVGRDQARDVIQSATAQAQQALSQQEQQQLDRSGEVQEGQQEQNRLLSSLAESFGLSAQRGEFTQQAEEEAGIGEKAEAVTDIQNKILTKERDFSNRIRTIQEDQTLSAAQKDARIADVERKQAQELADLSIIESTRLNDLNTAQALVDRKVELEFADRKAVLDAQKFFYQENKEALTKEEDRQFQRLIKKEDRAYEQAFARQQNTEKRKFDVMKQAAENGAPNEVLNSIQSAQTAEEAVQAAGGNLRDPNKVLQGIKLRQEIENLVNADQGQILDPKDRFDAETKLADKFDSRTQDFQKAQQQIRTINTSFDKALRDVEEGKSINAASQGVLVSFQKLLDPTSVVRESEYARSGQGLSLFSRLEGKYTQIQQGGAGVSAEDLREFNDLANEFFDGFQDAAIQDAELILNQANSVGLNVENIIPENVLEAMESRLTDKLEQAAIGETIEVGGIRYQKTSETEFTPVQ